MKEPVLLVLKFAREVTKLEKASFRNDDPDEPFGSFSPDYVRNLQKIYSACLTTHERNYTFGLHDPPLFQGVTEADARISWYPEGENQGTVEVLTRRSPLDFRFHMWRNRAGEWRIRSFQQRYHSEDRSLESDWQYGAF